MKRGKIIKSIGNSIKDEVSEVKSLQVTDEDLEQAGWITDLVVQAAGCYGVALIPLKSVIKKVIAYALRDLKEGVKTPDKLIIKRIIKEFKTKS